MDDRILELDRVLRVAWSKQGATLMDALLVDTIADVLDVLEYKPGGDTWVSLPQYAWFVDEAHAAIQQLGLTIEDIQFAVALLSDD